MVCLAAYLLHANVATLNYTVLDLCRIQLLFHFCSKKINISVKNLNNAQILNTSCFSRR